MTRVQICRGLSRIGIRKDFRNARLPLEWRWHGVGVVVLDVNDRSRQSGKDRRDDQVVESGVCFYNLVASIAIVE